MRPAQMISFLSYASANGLPVLLKGAPGVGKSDIVAQAAAAAGAELLISHPAVADPTDFKGLPWVAPGQEEAVFLPFGDFATALKFTGKKLWWFFDDLGQAPASVQAGAMQLFLARRVNGHVLPDSVTFIAATNRRTDRAGVTGILEPVKSRFAAIVELEPNIDDWCSWAFGHGMPAILIAFLRFRPDLLCKFEASADLTNSPLPRTWAHAGKLILLNMPPDIQHAALCGAVGEGPAVEYSAFETMFNELPSVDLILADPNSALIPDRPATRYAVVTALAMRTTKKNFPNVARYAERLTDAAAGEFAALLLRDAERKVPEIKETADFVRLATGPLGDLISGGN